MTTSALVRAPSSTVTLRTSHVFAPTHELDQPAARLAAVIDPGFVAEVGWDPASLTLSPPPGHRLLIRVVCRVEVPTGPTQRSVSSTAAFTSDRSARTSPS